MINKKRILGIIPARGGSKGIKNKNIALLNGKPLIYYSITSSLQSKYLDKVVVSTENKKIAEISGKLGAQILNRPAELSLDTSTDYEYIRHAIDHYDSLNDRYDLIVILRPTSPFRSAEQIDNALELIGDMDSLRSVTKVNEQPYWMKSITRQGLLVPFIEGKDEKQYYQRQLLPDAFILNGLIDIVSRKNILDGVLYGSRVRAFLTDTILDIDDPEDLKKAEDLL